MLRRVLLLGAAVLAAAQSTTNTTTSNCVAGTTGCLAKTPTATATMTARPPPPMQPSATATLSTRPTPPPLPPRVQLCINRYIETRGSTSGTFNSLADQFKAGSAPPILYECANRQPLQYQTNCLYNWAVTTNTPTSNIDATMEANWVSFIYGVEPPELTRCLYGTAPTPTATATKTARPSCQTNTASGACYTAPTATATMSMRPTPPPLPPRVQLCIQRYVELQNATVSQYFNPLAEQFRAGTAASILYECANRQPQQYQTDCLYNWVGLSGSATTTGSGGMEYAWVNYIYGKAPPELARCLSVPPQTPTATARPLPSPNTNQTQCLYDWARLQSTATSSELTTLMESAWNAFLKGTAPADLSACLRGIAPSASPAPLPPRVQKCINRYLSLTASAATHPLTFNQLADQFRIGRAPAVVMDCAYRMPTPEQQKCLYEWTLMRPSTGTTDPALQMEAVWFDFIFNVAPPLLSDCLKGTATYPTRSATATRTARPTMTARPTIRTVLPPRPPTEWIAVPSFTPLPSRPPPVRPVVSFAASPLPTPWRAVPKNVTTTDGFVRPPPPYIPSRLSLVGGDITTFSRPETIQQLQTSIACSLRLPLEKISIRTITVRNRFTGGKRVIPIDPTQFALASNGTVACLTRPPASAARRLQETDGLTGDEDIDLDFAILEPTEEITELSAEDLNTVLVSAPVIQESVADMGSAVVSASIVADESDFGNSTDIAPTPGPTEQPMPSMEVPPPMPSFGPEPSLGPTAEPSVEVSRLPPPPEPSVEFSKLPPLPEPSMDPPPPAPSMEPEVSVMPPPPAPSMEPDVSIMPPPPAPSMEPEVSVMPPPPSFQPIPATAIKCLDWFMKHMSNVTADDTLLYRLVQLSLLNNPPPALQYCLRTDEMPEFPLPARNCILKTIIVQNNGTLPDDVDAILMMMVMDPPREIQHCLNGTNTTDGPDVPDIPVLPEPELPPPPSRTPRPSFSARPSIFVRVSPAAIAERIVPPRALLSPLPSRKPAATPRISLARSPLPSPWFQRASPIPNSVSPAPAAPYIPSTLKLLRADPAEMSKPERIQELQASLACTLLLPLEKIQISALYSVTSAGVRTKLPVDPSTLSLSSNGEAGCFLPNRTTAVGRRLRQLQVAEQIQVDYNIVEPPQEIADLSVGDLSTILASSTVMTEMSASVGGTGVEAAPQPAPDSAAAGPSSSSGPLSAASSGTGNTLNSYIAYGIGFGGGFVAMVALAVAINRWLKGRTHRPMNATETAPVILKGVPSEPMRIMVIDNSRMMNPLFSVSGQGQFHDAGERRVAVEPQRSRV